MESREFRETTYYNELPNEGRDNLAPEMTGRDYSSDEVEIVPPSGVEAPNQLPLSRRGKILASAVAVIAIGIFAGRVGQQAFDAHGCTVQVGRDPLDLATAPFADPIGRLVYGTTPPSQCDR